MIREEAHEGIVLAAAIKSGILDYDAPRFDDLPAHAEARRFVALATGAITRLDDHLEEYLRTLKNEAKTVDMKRSTIRKFCEAFPHTADVHRKQVQRWVNEAGEDGKALATIRRALSELRGYWAYLQALEVVPEDAQPFDKLALPKTGKAETGERREAFTPADVVTLYRAALAQPDQPLADLIALGMWTGCRIEELCALRVDKAIDHFTVEDAKTEAGCRKVPIHSKLAATLARLVQDSTDGYVLTGLTANKYGDRSNAVGKRFGRLKTGLGFGAEHVFHSIRRTVATLLEDAGTPENVAADIIGHDKPTMTYGLYSNGTSLRTKREALEKLDYPGF
jgi:integrase